MILAGGTGSRVGADCPKQFINVLGKPVLAYTIDIYEKHTAVDAIEIVCHENWINYVNEMIKNYHFLKVKWVVQGGSTFQESVIQGINGLKDKMVSNDIVMIHYAAAPFTSAKIIADSIKVCTEKGMSVSCTPCYQLMGSNDCNGESRSWVDRDKMVQLACPQSFRYGYLLDIYERAARNGILENTEPHTTSLMYALGDTIYQSYGDQTNIKITTNEDIYMFEGYVLMKNRSAAENATICSRTV